MIYVVDYLILLKSFVYCCLLLILQETLFRMVGLPMVENCLSGYNSCMFAYGQVFPPKYRMFTNITWQLTSIHDW